MSVDTRAKILDTALELFRTRGFAETSMREIATQAGVATGLAYYYFKSKDEIVLAFYDRAGAEQVPLLEAAHTSPDLSARVRGLITAKLSYFAPNRRFLGALMGSAADPASPLSPFGERSAGIRTTDIGQYERAIRETKTRVPADLAPHLPKLLWMYQMGLILFWMYDRSSEQERTRRLLDASLPAVMLLVKAASLPFMRPVRRSVVELVELVEGAG